MNIKLAISGAQSTGKSTLLESLKKEYPKINFVEEITRDLKSKGFKINEDGNDDTQVQIMNLHKKYSVLGIDTIYDRCALDGLVYTQYLFNTGNVSEDVHSKSIEIFNEIINNYDIICYIRPEFDIVNDGERSVNLEFRDEIVQLFEYFIDLYNIKVIVLTGTVQDRVNQVKEIINDIRSK